MAICLIKKGGGGSADPDEITARANDVMQGKTTIDGEGEIVEGAIPLQSVNTDLPNVFNAFTRPDVWKTGGVIDSPKHGRGIITALKQNGKRLALDEQADFVFKSEPDLQPWNVLSTATIGNMRGTIPIWDSARSGHSDVLIAWNDEGHAINHPLWGMGVISKILNNHYIKGGNWVFLKEPNLLAHNIRQNVNMFGVTGTMPDYSAGKLAFNGATFDGLLLSGVAGMNNRNNSLGIFDGAKSYQFRNERSSTNFTGFTGQECETPGIRNGGLYIRSERTTLMIDSKTRDQQFVTSYIFSHSVNLSPFRRIKIGFKILDVWADLYDDNKNGNPWLKAIVRVIASVIKASTLQGKNAYGLNTCHEAWLNGNVKAAEYYSAILDARQNQGRQMWLEIDVSDLQGHYYLVTGAGTEYMHKSRINMIFNHIEFVN
jgi:hypothetical protein